MMLLLLLLNLSLGFVSAWFMAHYAVRFGLVDLPNDRSSHQVPTPRGGGIGILFGIIVAGLLSGAPLLVWLPAAGLSLVSFFDDRLGLSPRLRLLIQFAAAFAVLLAVDWQVAWLVRIPLLGLFAIFMVGTANFFNFMDGIDGIAGGTGLVTFALLALFGVSTGVPAWQVMLPAGIAAACLGFLPLNVPNARVFMGDVGSVLLGFAYATLVCLMSADLAGFICLLSFLYLFYADALSTLVIRWRAGEQLAAAHRRHLYQILCNELGIPHWQVAGGYGLIQLLIGGLMLLAYQRGFPWQLLVFVGSGVVFLVVTWQVRRHIATPGV